jgi:ABC-type sugar transport system ATPase subunit
MTDEPTATLRTVEVRGLRKVYPGVVALDGADVTIPGGEILGLLGKNGAGKSTMIKVLAGVVAPDAGEILVDGAPITLHSPHDAATQGFAFVHQELADVPNLTVAENVGLGLGYPKHPGGLLVKRRALRRWAATVLDRLEADIDPGAPLTALSVAQRRLVTIARGLAADARMFILDEPTASLTDDEIAHLHKVLRSLRADGVAIVYVSHRLDEVFAVTDRVTVMRDGNTVFSAQTKDIDKAELIEKITGSAIAPESRTRHVLPEGAKELLRVAGMTAPGVVEDASFTLREGELLGIAGLVGAGRTELMRLIFGADAAASGTVSLRGEELSIRSPRDAMAAGLALLPEDRKEQGAVLDFSVRKNVTLTTMPRFRVARGVPMPSERRERATTRDYVQRLKIKVANPEHPMRFLSGGNQQKALLAKWLGSEADVFIFDEPTHGIDVEGKEEIYDLMTELAARGKGVIFISSEFTELVGACNRVLVMRDGRVVSQLEGSAITDAALVGLCYAH